MSILMLENELRTKVDDLKLVNVTFSLSFSITVTVIYHSGFSYLRLDFHCSFKCSLISI